MPPVEYRFKPGQSGNPGGRPKGKYLTTILERELKKAGGAKAEAIIRSLIDLATTRRVGRRRVLADVRAIEKVYDRVEGRVPLGIEHSGSIGGHELDDDELNQRIAQLLRGRK